MAADAPDPPENLIPDEPPTASNVSAFWNLGKPGHASSSAASEQAQRIGRYALKEILGQGGMGQVFLAEQTEPVQRLVALKLIRRGMDTREVVARFESERQALALMNHPSIARVLDAGTADDGSPYFVMEYVPGSAMVQYCEEKNLGTRARLNLFVKVCEAIHHAHQKAIIHRDIKPSNVLVTEIDGTPVPKIIDFGIAKAMGPSRFDNTALTAMGQVIGTPEYMSPEQAGLNELDIDTRTDIYSLGVLLYELLTGVLPFDPKQLRQGGYANILRTICEEVPPRPSTRLQQRTATDPAASTAQFDRLPSVRELRGDLDWITMKALEKDRARRYSSASELAEDVRRHLSFEPVLAGPPSTFYRLRKLLRRHREKVIAGLVLLAVVAAFLLYDRQQEVREAQALLARGRDSAAAFALALGEKQALAAKLRQLQTELPPWLPIWEREQESRLLAEQELIRASIGQHYFDALENFEKARQAAPGGSSVAMLVDRAKEDLTWRQWNEAQQQRHVELPEEFFRRQLEAMNLGTYARELAGNGEVELSTNPPGAEVHCFRYEPMEQRLVPLAFDPALGLQESARGLRGQPSLHVERVWGPKASPFQVGDRLQRVNGVATQTSTALAHALEGVGKDAVVAVEVERAGSSVRFEWTPFPAAFYANQEILRPGRLQDQRAQLDLTFAGYPLDLAATTSLGTTAADRPLKTTLPRGSYLFLLRREGHADVRLPVLAPRGLTATTIQLFKLDEVPPGFLHVPAGDYDFGGDDEAYLSRPKGSEHVADFFIGRGEVTCGEYLECLNDKATRGVIDTQGWARYEAEWKSDELKDFFPTEGRKSEEVLLLPGAFAREKTLIRNRAVGGGFELAEPGYSELPVAGISMMAAVEYAHWLTQKHNGRWRFRLPRDAEWEKAARGVDGRPYVWGHNLVRTYLKEGTAHRPDRAATLEPCFAFPTDESVYGVRDLAGSAAEPTTVKALPQQQLYVYRGGYWTATNEQDLRAASRNRTIPWERYRQIGIRLVAEPR